MKFDIHAKVNATADKVWKAFADDFDGAYVWMASIPHSYGVENGPKFDGAESVGRVCEISPNPNGLRVSEKFLAYDKETKTCTVRIDFVNTPFIFPIDHNRLEFEVRAAGDSQSDMTFGFRSQLKPWAFFMWPIIRLAFGVFVGQIVEELKFFVENDVPHPRKIKAMNKSKPIASA